MGSIQVCLLLDIPNRIGMDGDVLKVIQAPQCTSRHDNLDDNQLFNLK